MAQISTGHDYYKKMLDLQEKLRKSEEERIRLEERFKVLVQESRNRHDACINRLRLRYIEFLEEQRARDERNHKLLGSLDRVDSSLALMTAKTDRLNLLRKQYEASLMRAYANRNPPSSTTGDSGIASQNEDRWPRRNLSQVHWISPEAKSVSSSMMRMDLPSEQSVSSIKLNPSTDRPFFKAAPLITQSDSVLQAAPRRNGVSNSTSATVRKNRKYSFSQDPSSRVYSSAYADPVRVEANEEQDGPSGAISMVETAPLSHQSVPRNVSQSVQMEPVQTAPRFLPAEIANANVSQYKLPYASPSVPPGFHSPMAQSSQFPSRMVVAHSQLRSADGTSGFQVTSQTPLNSSPIQVTYQEDPRDIRRSFRELGVHSLTNAEIDEIMQRDDPQPKKPIARRSLQALTPLAKKSISSGKEDEAAADLDNQLDRYIHKIRMTQREHDIRSLEDHEQNTSGDLLNVSLSDDDLDLLAEAKPTEQLPEEVERVLALANDLACRTLVDDVAAQESGKESGNENENITRPAQTRYEEPVGDRSDERRPPGATDVPKEPIEETALNLPEIDMQGDTEQPTRQGSLRIDSVEPTAEQVDDSTFPEAQGRRQSLRKEGGSFSPQVVEEEIEVGGNIHSGEEAELKLQAIDDLEELAPWDLKRVEKRVEEIDLYDIDKDQSTEKDTITEESSAQDSSGEQLGVLDLLDSVPTKLEENNIKEQLDDQSSKKPKEQTDTTEIVNVRKEAEDESKLKNDIEEHEDSQKEHKSNESKDTIITDDYKSEIQRNDESGADQVKLENNEQQENDNANQEKYVEDPNKSQEYQQDYYGSVDYQNNVDQTYEEYVNQQYVEGANEQFGEYPNQQYNQYEQDPNAQYEQDPNAQYEQDPNAQYEQDPNAQYEQDPNAQYEQDPNAQYEQDPNAQYEQDPNAQYEQDPNQEYQEYNYDQQYDPNLTCEDQNQPYKNQNEAYEYSEDVPRDDKVENIGADEGDSRDQQEVKTLSELAEGEEKTNEAVLEADKRKADNEESEMQEQMQEASAPKKKDVIKSLLDSDTDSTLEKNVTTTESDFDFN